MNVVVHLWLILAPQCSSVEMKLKQVTEEMNCQRHNAESVHRSLEQKIKDQERASQKVLSPYCQI